MIASWHTENFKAVTSPLTGNTIYVNLDVERFLIRPEAAWDHKSLRADLTALKQSARWNNRSQRSIIFLETVAPLLETPRFDTLVSAIDTLMAARKKWGQEAIKGSRKKEYAAALPWKLVGDKTRVAELIVVLWKAGVLTMPNQVLKEFRKTRWNLDLPWYTDIESEMARIGVKIFYQKQTLAVLDDLLLSISTIQSVGDIVPEVVNLLPERKRFQSLYYTIARVLRRDYGEDAPLAESYWPRITKQEDLTFSLITQAGMQVTEWAALAVEWLAQQKTALGAKRDSLRWLLQSLSEEPTLSYDPALLLIWQDGQKPKLNLSNLDPDRFNICVDFLNWVIDTRFSTARADGRRIPKYGVRNPLERKRKSFQPDETIRNVMPPWLLQMLVEVLTEDDWSWARTIVGTPTTAGKGDWFYRVDPETCEGDWVWCPARAVCLYGKLTFPSRTGQTRYLDSGEADLSIPIHDCNAPEGRQWRMVENTRRVPSTIPLTTLSKAAARHREHAQNGAVQVSEGIYRNHLKMRFTTNKTADQGRDAWNRGYTAPWMPEGLAIQLIRLRDWQIEYNPLPNTTPWTQVREFQMGASAKHPEVLEGMESAFLFRDPTNRKRPYQPILDGKVEYLYKALCLEVERRCRSTGLLGPDGQPIRLVESYNASGFASGLIYPLHALRVSIITHYIEDGGISPEIMMKIVGHATVVMTLYYVKHSGEYIANMMEEGSVAIRDKVRLNWIAEARDRDLEALRKIAFGTHDAAYTAFRSAPPGSLVSINIGVCPTGCTRCHEGGPLLKRIGDDQVYAEVRGGQSNCAGCRFLITGEPFLDGIMAEFNTRSLDLSLKNKHLNKLDETLLPLDDKQKESMRGGRVFNEHDKWRMLINEKQEVDTAKEQLIAEMANLMVLAIQVEILSKSRMESGETRMGLIVGDIRSVESALEESTEYDLVDRICRSADVFPSLTARGTSVVTAGLFRARTWDRLLRRLGLEPRFLDLDEELGRHIGNRMSQWFDMKIGRPNTLKLMEGADTLDEICTKSGLLPENFLHDLEQEIKAAQPIRLTPPRPQLCLVTDADSVSTVD